MLCLAMFCLVSWTSAVFLLDISEKAHLLTNMPFWVLSIVSVITVNYWLNHENIFTRLIDEKQNEKQKIFIWILSIPITILFTLFIVIIAWSFSLYSQKMYTERIKEYEKISFGHIQNYAFDNFKVPVVLMGKSGWMFTQNTLNPQYSPGLNWMSSGHCVMIADPDRITNMLPLFSNVNKKDWTTLILMHEVGHCVDISRDMPMGFSKQILGTHSIAPTSQPVEDLPTFFNAELDENTHLWREAFSDVFAVGYAYLNLKDPDLMVDALYKMRERSQEDVTHQTQCWLDAAKLVDKPVSNKKLLEWTDNIRTSSKCKLIGDRK